MLELGGVLPAGAGTLTERELLVLLGDTTSTPLAIEGLTLSDSSIGVTVTPGAFDLMGLRVSGPTRLVGASGSLMLKAVRPNPARGRTEIEYELAENAMTRLYIVDMLGRHVATLLDGAPLPDGI